MNRFGKTDLRDNAIFRHVLRLIPFMVGTAVLVIFWFGVNYISASSLAKQQESLQTAIYRDIAECYAIEGTYPPDLDYIIDHYGLTYNTKLFFVDYQRIGSNIFPDVTIICRDLRMTG